MQNMQSDTAIFLFSLCLLVGGARACYSRDYFRSTRTTRHGYFVVEEYRPAHSEPSLVASGPIYYKDLVYDSRKLVLLTSTRHMVVVEVNRTFVTKECEERLRDLAYRVAIKWNGKVKLRVCRGWAYPSYRVRGSPHLHIRHQDSMRVTMSKFQEDFHAAGRAVDIDLVSRRRRPADMNLGMLAKMAYYDARFDWCKRTKDYVHCSLKSGSQQVSVSFACFPANAQVLKADGRRIPMSQLTPGDRVLAMDEASGRLEFSRVELFLHRDPAGKATFVRLETFANGSITLTASHLLFRLRNPSADAWDAVFAQDVLPGDRILLAIGPALKPTFVVVKSSTHVIEGGFYAPLTEFGTIVVDDHVASCFAHVNSHRLANWVMAPIRVFARWTRPAQQPTQGLHWYPSFLFDLAQRILPKRILFPG